MADATSAAFRERARHEAERYGTDPWVFVRELLQNARDAGAHHVWFECSSGGGRERVSCRDDGCGMTSQHAQRYLFSLYASSKRGRPNTAGRFGIGFWAVLRFEPSEIIVRSRPYRGEAWQVRLDGQLETALQERASMAPGTEIVLERRTAGSDVERCLTAAILRDAPFLRCRHRNEHPLEVRVNGHLVREKQQLPPPSLSFRRRGLQGTVGLGSEPRAEIFAHGLRVRDAATLDELLAEDRPRRPALTGARGGLAPRVIIDSGDVEVLMARGDAREDRALRRLVAVGHRELSRLVRAELDRHVRLSPVGRLLARLREWWSASRPMRATIAVIVAAVVGFVAWESLSRLLPPPRTESVEMSTTLETTQTDATPYGNLWPRYRGPGAEGVAGSGPPVDLRYRPPDHGYFFAALWVTGLSVDGRLEMHAPDIGGAYEGVPCADECLEIDLGIDASAGLLVLPVATGHLVDPQSIRFDGLRMPVVAVDTGQPAVMLDEPRSGRLRYRSAPSTVSLQPQNDSWPPLPHEVVDFVSSLGGLSSTARATAASEYVARHVAYDISSTTVAKHRHARDRSAGLFARALAIGAGDCDVQNALVTAILDESGVPSRLSVGWVGDGGRAGSSLHAWAEYLDPGGRWRVVDASAVARSAQEAASITGSVETGAQSSRSRLPGWVSMIVGFAAALAAIVAAIGRRRWRRDFSAGDTDDVVALVRGAAVNPRAFENIHSLFSRSLLRLLSGRSISLARARKLAASGRLACGSARSKMARLAARGGGVVLDLGNTNSAAAADALAAVDLDRWSELVDRAEADELTIRVERRLKKAGEPCRIVVADRAGSEVTVFDGTVFGLGSEARWVIVDAASRLQESLCRLAERWPARAALLLADIVLHSTGAAPLIRRRCLAHLALEALLEGARRE